MRNTVSLFGSTCFTWVLHSFSLRKKNDTKNNKILFSTVNVKHEHHHHQSVSTHATQNWNKMKKTWFSPIFIIFTPSSSLSLLCGASESNKRAIFYTNDVMWYDYYLCCVMITKKSVPGHILVISHHFLSIFHDFFVVFATTRNSTKVGEAADEKIEKYGTGKKNKKQIM